jgi:hypothetical protein
VIFRRMIWRIRDDSFRWSEVISTIRGDNIVL